MFSQADIYISSPKYKTNHGTVKDFTVSRMFAKLNENWNRTDRVDELNWPVSNYIICHNFRRTNDLRLDFVLKLLSFFYNLLTAVLFNFCFSNLILLSIYSLTFKPYTRHQIYICIYYTTELLLFLSFNDDHLDSFKSLAAILFCFCFRNLILFLVDSLTWKPLYFTPKWCLSIIQLDLTLILSCNGGHLEFFWRT